jgi:putative ABC transport system ATP-binding protein
MTLLVVIAGVEVRVDGELALRRTTAELRCGEVLAIHGPSGSGKTTLLGVLAGWVEPSSGSLRWFEPLDRDDRRRWWGTAVVPQSLGLLPELSLLENVAIAHRLAGASWAASACAAAAALEALGIASIGDRRPSEVSLGQQQRTAVARAVTVASPLLLADEPTSHLDDESRDLVLDALANRATGGAAVVVASHDVAVLERADRSLQLG